MKSNTNINIKIKISSRQNADDELAEHDNKRARIETNRDDEEHNVRYQSFLQNLLNEWDDANHSNNYDLLNEWDNTISSNNYQTPTQVAKEEEEIQPLILDSDVYPDKKNNTNSDNFLTPTPSQIPPIDIPLYEDRDVVANDNPLKLAYLNPKIYTDIHIDNLLRSETLASDMELMGNFANRIKEITPIFTKIKGVKTILPNQKNTKTPAEEINEIFPATFNDKFYNERQSLERQISWMSAWCQCVPADDTFNLLNKILKNFKKSSQILLFSYALIKHPPIILNLMQWLGCSERENMTKARKYKENYFFYYSLIFLDVINKHPQISKACQCLSKTKLSSLIASIFRVLNLISIADIFPEHKNIIAFLQQVVDMAGYVRLEKEWANLLAKFNKVTNNLENSDVVEPSNVLYLDKENNNNIDNFFTTTTNRIQTADVPVYKDSDLIFYDNPLKLAYLSPKAHPELLNIEDLLKIDVLLSDIRFMNNFVNLIKSIKPLTSPSDERTITPAEKEKAIFQNSFNDNFYKERQLLEKQISWVSAWCQCTPPDCSFCVLLKIILKKFKASLQITLFSYALVKYPESILHFMQLIGSIERKNMKAKSKENDFFYFSLVFLAIINKNPQINTACQYLNKNKLSSLVKSIFRVLDLMSIDEIFPENKNIIAFLQQAVDLVGDEKLSTDWINLKSKLNKENTSVDLLNVTKLPGSHPIWQSSKQPSVQQNNPTTSSKNNEVYNAEYQNFLQGFLNEFCDNSHSTTSQTFSKTLGR